MVDKKVFKNAEKILQHLKKLNLISTSKELDFDVIYPFLLPIPLRLQIKISLISRIYREIIDCQNKNKYFRALKLQSYLYKLDKSLHIKTLLQYKNINIKHRKYLNTSFEDSYLNSIERVYYRKYLVKKYVNFLKKDFYQCLDIYSAFLLFDDDLYDYFTDIKNLKSTILIQISKEKQINDIIKDSIIFLNKIDNLECKKLIKFKKILEEYY